MSPQSTDIAGWLSDISPGGTKRGFLQKFDHHSLAYIDNGPRHLVITFDNLAELGNRTLMRSPWAHDFFDARGASVLGVMALRGIWYRDAGLISYLQDLSDKGFFTQFDKVLLTGNSMGGFAALAFAPLVPGADVLSFSPQTTLDKTIVPWETRFEKAWTADWHLPYSDAAAGLSAAGQVTVIYDPIFELDKLHAARIKGDNVRKLTAWYASHKSPVFLRRIEALKPITEAALAGELTADLFYDLYRARGQTYWYRNALKNTARARGHADLANRLEKKNAAAGRQEREAEDAKWFARGRALAGDARKQAALPRRAVAPQEVLLFASAPDFGPITQAWLRYHLQFFAPENLTLISEAADPQGVATIPAPLARHEDRLQMMLSDALSMGRSVMTLRTDEFLVVNPEVAVNPLAHLLATDGRPSVAPFGIEVVHDRARCSPPLSGDEPLLTQRPYFRFAADATKTALFHADATADPYPPAISTDVQLFNLSLFDHDRACLLAAKRASSTTPCEVSNELDGFAGAPASQREPIGPRLIARLYGNWARAIDDAGDERAQSPHPFRARNRLFELPKRYHLLF